MTLPAGGTTSDTIRLELDDRYIDVTVKRSGLARRTSLRVDAVRGAVLVLPPKASLAEGRRFLAAHRVWLAERLDRLPGRIGISDGMTLPFLGIPHAVRHTPHARRGVWVEDGTIMVSGGAEHLARRLGDFLKAEARHRMAPLAAELADRIGRKPGRISVKDTRSRWGSCSSTGDLAFSWRLVLAPEWVLTYVVGHEVAHLVEMNHSAAFWAVVRDLVGDPKPPQHWLKSHGPALHRFTV